jgi:iron-sulfur cluster insertion protein
LKPNIFCGRWKHSIWIWRRRNTIRIWRRRTTSTTTTTTTTWTWSQHGVFVSGGGCSGFQYGFTFDEKIEEGDAEFPNQGVTLLVDPLSIQYLAGAEIDYREDLEGAQFVIRNPNASTTCGCGSSFST